MCITTLDYFVNLAAHFETYEYWPLWDVLWYGLVFRVKNVHFFDFNVSNKYCNTHRNTMYLIVDFLVPSNRTGPDAFDSCIAFI